MDLYAASMGLWASFIVKHFVADYWWQTAEMIRSKGQYWHPAALAHYLTHGGLTLLALFISSIWIPYGTATNLFGLMLGLALFDMAVHQFVDWSKVKIVSRYGWTPVDKQFWMAFGVDQTLHMLTYLCIGIVWWSMIRGWIPN